MGVWEQGEARRRYRAGLEIPVDEVCLTIRQPAGKTWEYWSEAQEEGRARVLDVVGLSVFLNSQQSRVALYQLSEPGAPRALDLGWQGRRCYLETTVGEDNTHPPPPVPTRPVLTSSILAGCFFPAPPRVQAEDPEGKASSAEPKLPPEATRAV